MKTMRIIRCKWFPPKGFCAITLVWVIVAREGSRITEKVVNHERIHARQQKEIHSRIKAGSHPWNPL